jgi:L-2-hydroxyglutarate oxidase
MVENADYLIIGGGVMGLAVARTLRAKRPRATIILLEKEDDVARHASGRNSGVLHAGFYYAADSLKARFCRQGNAALRSYVLTHGLRLNDCKKVVVAHDEEELETLHELHRRAQVNGVNVTLVDERELADIEPNAKTFRHALYSPTTGTVDPVEVCQALKKELAASGVRILTRHAYESRLSGNAVRAGGMRFEADRIINCAGLYADRIAKEFGFCQHYTILPFKGVYLKYMKSDKPVRGCIYPVPNLKNPFLGVHFGVTVDGHIKIGPTAIPAFWRENYGGFSRFKPNELAAIMAWEAKLFATNAFGFRRLAYTELQKYRRSHLAALAARMVKQLDTGAFSQWGRPGIRAQLLDMRSLALVQDFIVEGDKNSVHVLNAVSPAFTSSFPFAEHVVEQYLGEI